MECVWMSIAKETESSSLFSDWVVIRRQNDLVLLATIACRQRSSGVCNYVGIQPYPQQQTKIFSKSHS